MSTIIRLQHLINAACIDTRDYLSQYRARIASHENGHVEALARDILVLERITSFDARNVHASFSTDLDFVDCVMKADQAAMNVHAIMSQSYAKHIDKAQQIRRQITELRIHISDCADEWIYSVVKSVADDDRFNKAFVWITKIQSESKSMLYYALLVACTRVARRSEQRDILIDTIEREKDMLLCSTHLPTSHFLSRHGLAAITPFALRDQCIPATGEESLTLMVYHRVARSNIEYDARGLLAPEYISQFPFDPLAGLSPNFIKRYQTIIQRPPHLIKTERVEILGKESSGPVYETFDDIHYRMISNHSDFTRINQLPTRPLDYNEIHWKRIAKSFTNDRLASFIANYKDETDVRITAGTDVVDDMVNAFRGDVSSITSPIEFTNQVMHSDRLVQVLMKRLYHGNTQSVEGYGLIRDEVVVSWITYIDTLSKSLLTELGAHRKTYMKQSRYDEIANQSELILAEYFEIFRDVCNTAYLSGMFTIRDGTFKNHAIQQLIR